MQLEPKIGANEPKNRQKLKLKTLSEEEISFWWIKQMVVEELIFLLPF